MEELESDSSDDGAPSRPRIGSDYLGRPAYAPGPPGRFTRLLQDYHGGVGWLDPEGQHWYQFDGALGQYVCGASALRWQKEPTNCPGNNESGGHNHPGIVTPSLVRLLRFNFVLRNFFALWGHVPTDEQYDLIAKFFARRVLDPSTPYWNGEGCPGWVGVCARSRFPYGSEQAKAHPSVKVMLTPHVPLTCVLELGSFCEHQRFGPLEFYTSHIPLDYEQVRHDRMPDRTLPYVQRWGVSGNF